MLAVSLLGLLTSLPLDQGTAGDRFPPVQVSDEAVRYTVTGQSTGDINAQLRQYAVSQGHSEQGHTRSEMDIHATLEPKAGACHMTGLEVRLHVTTTLPEWTPRWRGTAELRKKVTDSFSRLERHEAGHRENALVAVEALRSTVLALDAAESCPRLKAAIDAQFQKAQWRLEAQDDHYDLRTRYGDRDDPRRLRRELASVPSTQQRP